MSATNRGGKRRKDDFYETPSFCVQKLACLGLPGGNWLEPGAGKGAISKAYAEHLPVSFRSINWVAIEKRASFVRRMIQNVPRPELIYHLDFLLEEPPNLNYDFAIGNPPYSLAAEFVERALQFAPRVVFLLRLNFLGSKKRIEFYDRVGVPDVYVITPRPSFTGGGNDACEYGWFDFRREWRGRKRGEVQILD